MAATSHYVNVQVEIKYTVTECKDTDNPIKESRNQWVNKVKTEVPAPIPFDDFVLMKHAIKGTIESI